MKRPVYVYNSQPRKPQNVHKFQRYDWTMPGGQHGGQKLRVDLSLSIGENKDYYKVFNFN